MYYVIIGAGAAGLAAAETLRRLEPQSLITLISDEDHPPYSRPMLTYLLAGAVRLPDIRLRGADYFQEWGFQTQLGSPVAQVDPHAHEVRLASGRVCPYDRLLIATGADPRLPGLPGEDLPAVYTLRRLNDWQRLDAGLPAGGQVTVVGAGPVGLKAAEALVLRGCRVTLVEVEPQVLPNLLDETAAPLAQQALERMGMEVFVNARPTDILGGKGRVQALALADGRELPTDAVLLAVGVTPRLEFLAGTGLAGPDGIIVNPFMQTVHPDIYAAGDCIQTQHLLTGRPAAYRIWPAAVAQGRIAGANLAGAGRRYEGLLPQNSLTLKGFKVITGGLLQPAGEEGEVMCQLDARRGQYRRLVFQQGRLVGLTLVGEVEQAGIYFQLMAQKRPLGELPVDPRTPDFHPGHLWG